MSKAYWIKNDTACQPVMSVRILETEKYDGRDLCQNFTASTNLTKISQISATLNICKYIMLSSNSFESMKIKDKYLNKSTYTEGNLVETLEHWQITLCTGKN